MAGALHYFDAPLRMAVPSGVTAALLAAFAGLGVLCLVFAAPRTGRAAAAMALHIAGGLITVLAADLVMLLIGWELLSVSAFLLIAAGGRRESLHAAWRYLVFQIVAAALLFTGMALQVAATGSLAVTVLVPDAQPFVLLAVAIKTAAIPVHGWLVNGYPAAPSAWAPLLSVFATKVGVYTAARLLSLSPVSMLGAVMAVGGVVGALGQRTGRRLLSYHIISQVGYMMAGVGMATEVGITAGLFHAVNHILYKGLLFMVMGAVLLRTGRDHLNRLGGLARTMPFTFAFGCVASASIAGLPPFNGFASKELLKVAVGSGPVGWLLTLATIGTGLSFIKFMYLVFLRPRVEPYPQTPREAPGTMLVPMGILAVLCLLTGLWPGRVSGVEHAVYTVASLRVALWPLAGSVLLWAVFRRRLSRYQPKGMGDLLTAARAVFRRLRAVARAAQGIEWQSALGLALAVWIVVVLFFSWPGHWPLL